MRKTNDRQHFRSQRHSDDSRRPYSRPALTIISANVEGLSSSKEELLANICKDYHCHVLCLQETHRGTTHKRPKIHGMAPAVEPPHAKHGSAIFVKTGTTIESTSVIDDNDVKVLKVELRGVAATSVNKPPGNAFQMHTLLTSKPQMVIGDFNSHSINWSYRESNLDGEAVKAWAEASHLSLLYNAKLSKSFNSER